MRVRVRVLRLLELSLAAGAGAAFPGACLSAHSIANVWDCFGNMSDYRIIAHSGSGRILGNARCDCDQQCRELCDAAELLTDAG